MPGSIRLGKIAAIAFLLAWPFRGSNSPTEAVLDYLAASNFLLGVFNLIPGFPLDGGRILRSIAWKITGNIQKSTRIASYAGQAMAFVFILLGIAAFFTGNFFNGLWSIFIGWFLLNAAQTANMQILLQNTPPPAMTFTYRERRSFMTKKAVCVGINDYPYDGNDLNGCVNDAKASAELLISSFDFSQADVKLLLDAEATKGSILTLVNALWQARRRWSTSFRTRWPWNMGSIPWPNIPWSGSRTTNICCGLAIRASTIIPTKAHN